MKITGHDRFREIKFIFENNTILLLELLFHAQTPLTKYTVPVLMKFTFLQEMFFLSFFEALCPHNCFFEEFAFLRWSTLFSFVFSE